MDLILAGAGELGSRHLQAMAAMEHVRRVFVVEPYESSRTRALKRWREVPGHAGKQLAFVDFAEVSSVSAAPAAAVIATPSTPRLDALSALLRAGVTHILCEKILFQSVAEYRLALQMAEEADAKIYVNHIYRYVPLYAGLRKRVAGKAPLEMTVRAGNNGMGCNLIHFLDLFEFIGGEPIDALDAQIDQPLLECKRGGEFIEFTGEAHAKAGANRLHVSFKGEEPVPPVVTVQCGGLRVVVDEAKGIVEASDDALLPYDCAAPRVSALTARLLPEIVSGAVQLPSLKENANANFHMLGAFLRALELSDNEQARCAIT